MLNYLCQRPNLTIWLKIAGWLSLFAILLTSPVAALLYYEYRVPQVTDLAALSEFEKFYHHTVTNLTMVDHWSALILFFLGYKAMTWLERQLNKPTKTTPQS